MPISPKQIKSTGREREGLGQPKAVFYPAKGKIVFCLSLVFFLAFREG
jgi:hypothetical protein